MLDHKPIATQLTQMLKIPFPVIMAPMFLVSDTSMAIEAAKCGITGAIPALNYRSTAELHQALETLGEQCPGPFGINLIANKSNVQLKDQLNACLEHKVSYIITSLGNPENIIKECHRKGILVFCDVVDEKYARKVESLGADALIAVNANAGGHAGNLKPEVLIPLLKDACHIPIISAGGVGDGAGLKQMLDLGACGISMGSPFIASVESPVSDDYKQACVQYSAEDIVMTTKLSGTPCTVINTPFVQKTGTSQNALERLLNKSRSLKKFVKMLTFFRGMQQLRKAAFSNTYKSVWCAGPSIAYVKAIKSIAEIVDALLDGYYKAGESGQKTENDDKI